ncbi:hypothetical protein P3T27_007669 [Kitasatospora sp. MAA19]|uniref:hypothetical protein n=1 Tax=unclassified Kitasatospora TaxID=2633591 RepID=UPI002473C4DE|nr:hypothetical protein [Kitasatospora sp. MAA19]MDH6710918.1 hypothetical protein [Kitasatospora sp. MAA19]
MPTAYTWSGSCPVVVYAPDVPRERRARERHGILRGWRPKSTVGRLGDQALYTKDLAVTRARLLGQRPDPKDGRGYEFPDFWYACCAVWKSAQPVAGIVDLAEVDHLLAEELWTGAQLIAQLKMLDEQPYNTVTAISRLLDQLDSRRADLAALAEQNTRLYEASGSDPSTAPEVVRRALEHAESLNAHRPVQDLSLLTASLREVVQRMLTAEKNG